MNSRLHLSEFTFVLCKKDEFMCNVQAKEMDCAESHASRTKRIQESRSREGFPCSDVEKVGELPDPTLSNANDPAICDCATRVVAGRAPCKHQSSMRCGYLEKNDT